MAEQRRAGLIQFQMNGEIFDAKGEYTYNLGRAKRTAIVGADRVHGFTEEPQVGFIEGAITDRRGLDLNRLVTFENSTATLQLANGKVIVARDAYYAGEGSVTTKEGEIAVRIEGNLEEVR